jgi:hypothetical protein
MGRVGLSCLGITIILVAAPLAAQESELKGRASPTERSEVEALRQELETTKKALRRLEEDIASLKNGGMSGAPKPDAAHQPTVPPEKPRGAIAQTERPGRHRPHQDETARVTQAGEERELDLGTLPGGPPGKTPLELLGLPRPEIFGTKISGFVVGSFNYNSHLQMVPEFAGGAAALADPGRTNVRFDKFGLAFNKTFAPWLFASAAIEVENHRDRHTHGFAPSFGCRGGGTCVERFGAEEAETEINLDRFSLTAIAPIGNGLSLSLGRFDVPFGIERHDENLILTATTSEVFRFGRPERMTGFQTSYTVSPWLDVSAWVVNRWENEVTGEDDFNDNNRDKSFGGRIGFTPFPREGLLNVGLGGFWGPEQDDRTASKRWVLDLDVTWQPISRLLFAGELIYGEEDRVSFREVGIPIAAPAVEDKDVRWWGFYLLGHYKLYDWLGLSFRYGLFDDLDGRRTGVKQVLQSWTFTPTLHLSRLIPDLKPTGAAYARTRIPIEWVDLKLEYRLNHSNRPIFSDARPGEDILQGEKTGHQVQLQLVVNF